MTPSPTAAICVQGLRHRAHPHRRRPGALRPRRRPAPRRAVIGQPALADMIQMMRQVIASGTGARADVAGLRPGRQDRHHQRLPRRLVRRLHRRLRHRGLGRPGRQHADEAGHRRRRARGDLARLHEARRSPGCRTGRSRQGPLPSSPRRPCRRRPSPARTRSHRLPRPTSRPRHHRRESATSLSQKSVSRPSPSGLALMVSTRPSDHGSPASM